MIFPILYKKSVKGAIQQWQIFVNGNSFYTEAGQKDGQITQSLPTFTEGKNIGKANETTPEQQAILDAQAKYDKKIKEGYCLNIEDVDVVKFIKPMLAVVSSSIRPTGILAQALLAILIALSPFSGSIPACADLPFTKNFNLF